jgi:hypothetical protein
LERGVDAVVAVIGFGGVRGIVDRAEFGIFGEHEGLGFFDEGAGEFGDDGGCGVGIGFFVVGFANVQDVAGVFDEGVLEAAAGAEEGNILFAGETNGGEGAVHIGVWAAGDAPEGAWIFCGDVGG